MVVHGFNCIFLQGFMTAYVDSPVLFSYIHAEFNFDYIHNWP